jgi:hypothetical protein
MNLRFEWTRRAIFLESSDAFEFIELNVDWRFHQWGSALALVDFHRFQAVYNRLMGW